MTDTTARARAAHYFDRNIAPAERAAGLSDDMTEAGRIRYIRDTAANPEAVRQLTDMYPRIAAACFSCGAPAAIGVPDR
ncbi:hypothetical protein [Micromonospora sp. NPDC023633]|uniref:hypothetical protein n=1 Tax=Micromonospora sp. NPDC023633 TaxID=3154320 RepID=UPI0033DF5B7C